MKEILLKSNGLGIIVLHAQSSLMAGQALKVVKSLLS
jgi:hypothetical protein